MRLRAGDLRAALAHLNADAIVAVQLRYQGQSVWWEDDNGPDLVLLTGVAGPSPSDVVPEPIGTDPMTESTVTVLVLNAWMGDDERPGVNRIVAEMDRLAAARRTSRTDRSAP